MNKKGGNTLIVFKKDIFMIKTLIFIGIIASTIMYMGDLFLYYSKEEYDKSITYHSLNKIMSSISTYRIMSAVSKTRIRIGALSGVLAGFLGAVASFHIYYLMDAKYQVLGLIISLIWMFSFVVGGTFHSHWFYFSLMKDLNEKTFKVIEGFVEILRKITYISYTIANALLFIVILFQMIKIPIYMLVVTPAVLFYLLLILRKLPQPYYLMIVGGWGNIPFIIYYAVLFFVV